MMRLLGLDVGTKTIGVAVSDLLGLTAQGITTIRRKSLEYDLTELEKIVKEYGAEGFVIGLPLNMNGTEGESAERARFLGDTLIERFGLPIFYQDERLSTVSATRALLAGDVSRKGRKQVVDKLAAVFILQAYMENPRNQK